LTTRVSERLGCWHFNRKRKICRKKKQILRITKTTRQTESKTINKSEPRQDPKSPLRR
jgi:hypothetical protein